jgi:hypothetical protein
MSTSSRQGTFGARQPPAIQANKCARPAAISAPTCFVIGAVSPTCHQALSSARLSPLAGRSSGQAASIRQESPQLNVNVATPPAPSGSAVSPPQALHVPTPRVDQRVLPVPHHFLPRLHPLLSERFVSDR